MKILYIGNTSTHDQYVRGIVPSHWLYGAVEMEAEGHDVIWSDESQAWLNDIKLLKQYRPDSIFVPNLNLRSHILLLLLSSIHIIRIPIYAYLHHEPKVKKGFKSLLYKILLSGVTHIFFLSQKTMEETTACGLAEPCKCSVPGWGPDTKFYGDATSKVSPDSEDGEWFVSTGKECRDFDILIKAFERVPKAKLHILTAKAHGGANYEDLPLKCKDIPNIKVTLMENSGNSFPVMLDAMMRARALVCPLKRDKLNYCVGLSTIADAEGLPKPLIITRNPYHSIDRVKNLNVVESVEDWVNAINELLNEKKCRIESDYSMRKCYEQMKMHLYK